MWTWGGTDGKGGEGKLYGYYLTPVWEIQLESMETENIWHQEQNEKKTLFRKIASKGDE
jgi:hypothetical protein